MKVHLSNNAILRLMSSVKMNSIIAGIATRMPSRYHAKLFLESFFFKNMCTSINAPINREMMARRRFTSAHVLPGLPNRETGLSPMLIVISLLSSITEVPPFTSEVDSGAMEDEAGTGALEAGWEELDAGAADVLDDEDELDELEELELGAVLLDELEDVELELEGAGES